MRSAVASKRSVADGDGRAAADGAQKRVREASDGAGALVGVMSGTFETVDGVSVTLVDATAATAAAAALPRSVVEFSPMSGAGGEAGGAEAASPGMGWSVMALESEETCCECTRVDRWLICWEGRARGDARCPVCHRLVCVLTPGPPDADGVGDAPDRATAVSGGKLFVPGAGDARPREVPVGVLGETPSRVAPLPTRVAEAPVMMGSATAAAAATTAASGDDGGGDGGGEAGGAQLRRGAVGGGEDEADRATTRWRDASAGPPTPHVDLDVFHHLTYPEWWQSALSPEHCTVYVPHLDSVCDRLCRARASWPRATHLLGRGAFGEAWRTPANDLVLKVSVRREGDFVHTAWVSGVVRSNARLVRLCAATDEARPHDCGVPDNDSRVDVVDAAGRYVGPDRGAYHNILVALVCCVKHRVTISAAYCTDLYRFDAPTVQEVSSYWRAFAGLASGVRFLNLQCRLAHGDISPLNVLLRLSRTHVGRIDHAVLCDFSLVEPHPFWGGRCGVVLEATGGVRVVPAGVFNLCEMHHPAFRPCAMQTLICMDPLARFPAPTSERLCVSELCALANVATFFLLRLLNEGDVQRVKDTAEARLFEAANMAASALVEEDMERFAQGCSIVLTRQLGYAGCVLGSGPISHVVGRFGEFFAKNYSAASATAFRRAMRGEHGATGVDEQRLRVARRRLGRTLHGRCFLHSVGLAVRVCESAQFSSVRPQALFPPGVPHSLGDMLDDGDLADVELGVEWEEGPTPVGAAS